MEKLTDPSVSKIVFLAARQMGKSTVFLNYLGYLIHMNPASAIIIQPTVDLAEKFSQTRVSNMFRDTPCLKGLAPDDKSRDSTNKILYKECPGMFLILTGANSTSGIISMPVPIIYFDEIDQYARDIRAQGDVISIAEKMQTNFPNRKSVYTSTCTVKGQSRIEAALETSTLKRWSHCCPSCGEWSQFGLRGEETPDDRKAVWQTRLNFENMKAVCPRCLAEHTRREWEASGSRWIPQNPDSKIEGYHINAFDHPSITWEMIAEEFIEANDATKRGDFSLLISFTNSRLAETWEERGITVESHALEVRREVYNAELPDYACVITAGVDVQHDRLAVGVWAWGMGFENWLLEYTEYWGDPRQGEVWGRIDDLLGRSWSYGNGKRLRISRMAVDAGDGNLSPQILSVCKARQSRVFMPLKARGETASPLSGHQRGRVSGRCFWSAWMESSLTL
jgi:phage terminase large subunit GpA-like protein